MIVNLMPDSLTLVALSWRKRKRNDRLLFGAPVQTIRLDWQRRMAAFRPGEVFAYERWRANKFGTRTWSIHVLEAAAPGDPIVRLPGLFPGAKILTSAFGKVACLRLLSCLDLIAEAVPPERVLPDDWRLIGIRLSASLDVADLLNRVGERSQ